MTLSSMMVANHQPEAWALLVEVARREQNQHKVGILLSTFALIRHDPAITELTRELSTSERTSSAARTIARSLPKAPSRGRCHMPQSGTRFVLRVRGRPHFEQTNVVIL